MNDLTKERKRIEKAINQFIVFNSKRTNNSINDLKGYNIINSNVHICNGVYCLITRLKINTNENLKSTTFKTFTDFENRFNTKDFEYCNVGVIKDEIARLKQLKKMNSPYWTAYIKISNDSYNYIYLDKMLKCFNDDFILIKQLKMPYMKETILEISDFDTKAWLMPMRRA